MSSTICYLMQSCHTISNTSYDTQTGRKASNLHRRCQTPTFGPRKFKLQPHSCNPVSNAASGSCNTYTHTINATRSMKVQQKNNLRRRFRLPESMCTNKLPWKSTKTINRAPPVAIEYASSQWFAQLPKGHPAKKAKKNESHGASSST